jgi:hypothetical protein
MHAGGKEPVKSEIVATERGEVVVAAAVQDHGDG